MNQLAHGHLQRRRDLWYETHMLEDLGTMQAGIEALHPHFTKAVVLSEQTTDQRCLAAAVRTDHAVNFSRRNRKADIRQNLRAAEHETDVVETNCGSAHAQLFSAGN